MNSPHKFVELNIKYGDSVEYEYVNINHILRFYAEDGDIIVFLTNGTNLLVTDTTISQLLDKLQVFS
jgi:DNA-binding LytR/AlgR family response regulator